MVPSFPPPPPLYAPWRPDAPHPVCINGTTRIVYQCDYDASSNVTIFFKADFIYMNRLHIHTCITMYKLLAHAGHMHGIWSAHAWFFTHRII